MSGKEKIAIPKKRRKPSGEILSIKKAAHNNLKKIDVDFPLGLFTAVTGVSGSGKSSLITDILHPALASKLQGSEQPIGAHEKITGIEHIDKVIAIDQSPIGRNPRSNPATYIKAFDEIRRLFSELPESRARGYLPGRFSFNAKEGACTECAGRGVVRVDMDFMEDLFVDCPLCSNQRFDPETLSIYYKGKNIHDVLNMTVSEALAFFEPIPLLKQKLGVLENVGMGYITLGQSSTTLSGGEAQRVKLAKELSKTGSGRTLYILDEPTTGLHFQDVRALLELLHKLVDRGNSVIVIEHNMEVVKTADWIIDLGPEGGALGGKLVGSGAPEEIARQKTPTGRALKAALSKAPLLFEEKKRAQAPPITTIDIVGASENNLKGLNLSLPRGQITICTGPSGSGKSSLALDTVYAEGQRRYIESLSPYARQFVQQSPKPKLTSIEGLSPAVAIEQKVQAGNPRSTVGTMTEIYDYLRILYAHKGQAFDPETGEKIESITRESVIDHINALPSGEKILLLAPLEMSRADRFEDLVLKLRGQGYLRLRLNGEIFELDSEIPFDRKRKNEIAVVIDRFKVSKENRKRISEAVEQALRLSKNLVLLVREDGSEQLFNLAFAVKSSGKSYQPLTPHTFSFNSPEGMCPECQGLGFQYGANFKAKSELMELSTFELFSIFFSRSIPKPLSRLFKEEKIDPSLPLEELSPAKLAFIFNGSDKWFEGPGYRFSWLGLQNVLARAARIARPAIRLPLTQLMDEVECPSCRGSRLKPLSSAVILADLSIGALTRLSLEEVKSFIEKVELIGEDEKVLAEVIAEIKARLEFLIEIGLHYISLDRRASTLSNGEAQRIRLAKQLGSHLTGVLYVLDEPTVGLHPKDNDKLNSALKRLKELGNTLLLVEHDPLTVKNGDYILDFGPGAGIHGGYLMAQGSYSEILKDPHSLTGQYLSGRKKIEMPKARRRAKEFFHIEGAASNNLKNLSLALPLGIFTCLTGVSGSGKSTLMHEVILPRAEALLKTREPFDKIIAIDQNPIGHTVRADVGTYTDLAGALRSFYASLGRAKTAGLQPKHFSYNHRAGMCSHCYGLGYKKVDLLFLPSVRLLCPVCGGLRLNPVSLEVNYQGKNFGQLLDMTLDELLALFHFLPKAKRILETLISVGLGYLKCGQEIPSLSSGEAQRLKLSRELAKRGTGKTLYLIDEPTSGLHPDDINKLLSVLHRLVDRGNTLIAIEHNTEFIKNADYLFDLGPDAGIHGGYLVASGTPEEVAKTPGSYTGKYLKF